MPDEIDRLVDAETEAELNAPKPVGLAVRDNELISQGGMTRNAARELTEQIKATATATYVLIHRAHEYKVWLSLDYSSWADYVESEFDMSKSRSYQLINQAKVVDAIQDVVPDGTKVSLTEAQARDVEKALPRITERIRKETENQSPETASKTVNKVVQETRDELRDNPVNDTPPEETVPSAKPDYIDDGDSPKKPAGKKSKTPKDPDDSDDADMDNDFESFNAFDNTGSSVISVGYIFAFFEGIGDPVETAKHLEDKDKDTSLKSAEEVIEWMTKFRDAIK
mgnify:FL=1